MLSRIRNNYGGLKAYMKHLQFNLTGFATLLKLSKIKFTPKNRIVFVCKGNICRSAFAHWYMAKRIDNQVESFGLITDTGKPANHRILSFSKLIGVDLSDHLTTSVEDYQYLEDDILVCMEPWQYEKLKTMFPNADVTILSAYLDKPRLYLHDPYASSEEYAKTSLELICQSVDNWISLSKSG